MTKKGTFLERREAKLLVMSALYLQTGHVFFNCFPHTHKWHEWRWASTGRNLHKSSSYYLLPSKLMAFKNSKRFRRSSVAKDPLLPDPQPSSPREVPRVDRFMQIYIKHSQPIYIHHVKWHLEIASRLGGVRRKRISSQPTNKRVTDRQTCSKTVLLTLKVYRKPFFSALMTNY